MNNYTYLKEENTEDTEIKNDKQLRNYKKKLAKKQQKKDKTEQDKKCIKMLETEIYDYENKDTIPQKKPKQSNKQSQKNKSKEDDDFLNKEYKKNHKANKERQKKQEQEEKEKERIKQENYQRWKQAKYEKRKKEEQEYQQRQEQRQEYQQKQEQWKNHWQNNNSSVGYNIKQLLNTHNFTIKTIPKDVLDFMKAYSKEVYRKLSLKYHPDKGGDENICKLLNDVKDNHV